MSTQSFLGTEYSEMINIPFLFQLQNIGGPEKFKDIEVNISDPSMNNVWHFYYLLLLSHGIKSLPVKSHPTFGKPMN